MKLIRKLKEVFGNRHDQSPSPLNVSGAGFTSEGRLIAWSEIIEINAFKLDNLTYDEAMLEFVLRTGLRVLVSEDHPEFVTLEETLFEQFPGTASWRDHVLLPPFDRSFTNLYSRV